VRRFPSSFLFSVEWERPGSETKFSGLVCASDTVVPVPPQAYSSWMMGNVKFEELKWQEALDAFGQSQ